MKDKKILITGGAGFLGKNIIKSLYDHNDITVFSRDESKHYFLKKQYPKLNFIIGDVRDYESLNNAAKRNNIGIFAASLKQIEAVDQNTKEASHTIINGAFNSRTISEKYFESACFISTDKSRSATTIYGAMKFVAGESFIVNSENSNCKLSTAIYGNVLNSTGSIIPLIWDAIKNNYSLKLYSEEMTRFIIEANEAVDLIKFSLNESGYNVIPNIKSILIKDLFEIYKEKFNLKFEKSSPRISEKIHEIMVSKEESPRVFKKENYFLMHYKNLNENFKDFINSEFSSENCQINKHDLFKFLESKNFYKE